jgi:predicted dehydrogenase
MLNLAYIGFGTSVVRYHLPFLESRKDKWNVKYIYQPTEERVKNGDRESLYPTINFVSDMEIVYNDEDIDVVVICSPNSTHYAYAMEILGHGKNVLIEKPIALEMSEVKEIIDFAKESNLIAMPNHNRRFDTDFISLVDALNTGKLGQIVEVESHYDYFREIPLNKNGGLEVLYGLGIHTIDQMVSLFGKPKYQVNDVRSLYFDTPSDDYFDIDLFYDQFKVTVKTSMRVLTPYPRFIVHGTKGSFIKYAGPHNSSSAITEPYKIDDSIEDETLFGKIEYIEDEVKKTQIISSKMTDYGQIYDSLYDSICFGKEKCITDEQLITDMEIVFDALESVRGRKI